MRGILNFAPVRSRRLGGRAPSTSRSSSSSSPSDGRPEGRPVANTLSSASVSPTLRRSSSSGGGARSARPAPRALHLEVELVDDERPRRPWRSASQARFAENEPVLSSHVVVNQSRRRASRGARAGTRRRTSRRSPSSLMAAVRLGGRAHGRDVWHELREVVVVGGDDGPDLLDGSVDHLRAADELAAVGVRRSWRTSPSFGVEALDTPSAPSRAPRTPRSRRTPRAGRTPGR